jgi:hypothetical protein
MDLSTPGVLHNPIEIRQPARGSAFGSGKLWKGSIRWFQRDHPGHGNVQGGFVHVFHSACTQDCRPLHLSEENIETIFSNDLYVIALFHGTAPYD